ncbi:hypothetical protein D9V32_14520 [Mycetocola tolaasinivorans]|uniref:F420-dependent oxidoreductase n=1 Tax=Mycetocola tolaasinivorans TaxID=76635 RepID=A0A3L6ZZ47_9MICO|nr:Pr6Pr family membrane protein [Mycetocola tolaasinivorans]RLP73316.1 hypothetical protein D9V32_14520 [Mycetocola tolaasinivorans]
MSTTTTPGLGLAANPVAGVIRIAFAALSLAAVIGSFTHSAASGPVNPFNFFGYFTIQNNLLMAVVLAIVALRSLRGRAPSLGWSLARGFAVSYIAVVGLVYNTLLVGVDGGASLPWTNFVMHVLFPIIGVLDWIIFTDRVTLPWRTFWWVLIYPAVWTIVILIRGATDGWVPYPFLNPANGYGVVALYCLGVVVAFLASAAMIYWISRIRPGIDQR